MRKKRIPQIKIEEFENLIFVAYFVAHIGLTVQNTLKQKLNAYINLSNDGIS